jgi:PAS domain S-box-containing protein
MADKTLEELLAENADLKARLQEAEENLTAIRTGGVDALVISGPRGEQVYTLSEADRPYRIIVEEMNEGTVTTDDQGTILYSNKQFSKMLGVPLSKVIGSSVYDHVTAAYHPIILKFLLSDRKDTGKAEVIIKGEGKADMWASISFSPLQIDQALIFCIIVTDITLQKNTRKILQEREERFRILADTIPSFAWMADDSGRIFWYNKSWYEYTGMTPEDMEGLGGLEAYHPDHVGQVLEKLSRCFETGEPCEGSTILLKGKEGGYRWFHSGAYPSKDDRGNIICWIGISTDITENTQIKAALDKSERNLIEAQRIGQIGSWEWDMQTGELHWSPELYSLYGVDPNTFVPTFKSFLEFVHPDDLDCMRSFTDLIISTRAPASFDFRIISADGSTRILNAIVEITDVDEKGSPCFMVGVNQDITDRKQTEARIVRQNLVLKGISRIFEEMIRCDTEEDLGRTCLEVIEAITESKYSFINEQGPDGLLHDIAISDPGWELCTMYDKTGHRRPPGNFIIQGLYGRVVLDGKSLMTNDPSDHPDSIGIPEGHPALHAFLGVPLFFNGRPVGMIGVANRDGGYRPEDQEALESLAPVVVEAFLRKRAEEELRRHRDNLEELVKERTGELEERNTLLQEEILQRRKAEEEKKTIEHHLVQSQKMEALGRFASGIAHDMNNLLYPVLINTQMLLDESIPGSPFHQTLEQSLTSVYRQRDLIRQLLSFSRKDKQQLLPLQVKPLIKETLAMMRSFIPSTVRIKQSSMHGYRDMVLGNPTQIQQIMMNLCRNAVDALESQKGMIEVSLGNMHLDSFQGNPDLTAGEYLTLEVKDTGSGMTPEVMSRIFEPFFTTKEAGKGTGMGLAVIHGIIQAHRGAITVESEPGKGTKITVYLPLISEESQSSRPGAGAVPHSKGKGRILLIDDEESILKSLRKVLKMMGYDVVTGKSGFEAINVFSKIPDSFDLVISDLTMPGMTGMELAEKLVEIRSDIRILLCTGLNNSIDSKKMKDLGICGMLEKPADVDELRNAIDRALDNK